MNRVGAPGGPVVPRDGGDELGPAGDHGVLVTPRVGLVEERPGRSLPGGQCRAKVRPSLPEVEDAREPGERGDLRPYLARARVGLLAPRDVAEEARGVLVHGGGTRDACAPRALNDSRRASDRGPRTERGRLALADEMPGMQTLARMDAPTRGASRAVRGAVAARGTVS